LERIGLATDGNQIDTDGTRTEKGFAIYLCSSDFDLWLNPNLDFVRGVAQFGLARLTGGQEVAGSNPVAPIFSALPKK
jgi:hypothetical protein